MFRNQVPGKPLQSSPYKTAKIRQHYRSRSRSKSPNRSFSHPSVNTSINASSVQTQYLWNIIQETQVFPPLCIQMMKYQQRNINDFKKSINRQKNRINSQLEAFSVEISHLIEDYRLSLLAVMDRIYQQYITKYADFKSQILQINRLKDEVEAQFAIKQTQLQSWAKMQNLSNQMTIKSMQAGKTQLKKYQIIRYIAQMQKQKILPLNQKAMGLLILSEYDNGFFQPQQFKNYMNSIKTGLRQNIHHNLNEVYGYIRDPQNIIFKQIKRRKEDNRVLSDIDRQRDRDIHNQSAYGSQVRPSMRRLNSDNPYNHSNPVLREYPEHYASTSLPKMSNPNIHHGPIYQQQNYQPTFEQVPSQPYLSSNNRQPQHQQMKFQYSREAINRKPSPASFQNDNSMYHDGQNVPSNSMRTLQPNIAVEHSTINPQIIVSPYKVSLDSIRISQQNQFSFKSKSMDIILCSLLIDDNVLAVGSKDGSLLFYDRNGNVMKAHQNVHKSPVCTLQLVNNGQLLASGSDHPNPEIILWNLVNFHNNTYQFSMYCRLKQHKGAVTAIQCLQDNQHIISGSYDKKLCVYSISQKKLKYTLPSNKNSVTALTLNNTGMKLISCCLQNNSINIWQIVRNRSIEGVNKVDTIFLQQVVQNNTMICSLVSSVAKSNIIYIGTKDGKLKIVDIDKGQSIKVMNCCNNALIQMLIIQHRQGFPVILCWPCKEKCFKMVDCQNGKVLSINTRGQLDFSCGVGPKATKTKDGSGFVVCSQGEDREIFWYKINRAI